VLGVDNETTNVDELEPIETLVVPESASRGPISHAMFRVQRLHKMNAAQLLRQVGLHPSQELAMMQLWDRGPQRQADLVKLLGSDAATMTRTIQRLEVAGFVRRRPCETDRRVTIVEPTAASLALRDRVEAVWAQLEARTTRDLSPEQKANYLEALAIIEGSLSSTPAPNEG
jgi:DNA-binding MarR family transcriptional regulator